MAGGDDSTLDGSGVMSPSPELLFSLGSALAATLGTTLVAAVLLALLSLSPFSTGTPLGSSFSSAFLGFGVRQVGSCQETPVKLLS